MNDLTVLQQFTDKKRFWAQIDYIMQQLYLNFPNEMKQAEEEAKYMRAITASTNATSRDKSLTALGIVPSRFDYIFNRIYPNFDNTPYKNKNDFLHDFFRRYTHLAVRQKI